MSHNEFYHEALVRRLRDRDDCDDDIRGACDEIEDCYESKKRLEAEVDRLRLTDEERAAILASQGFWALEDSPHADTLRKLLERMA